MFHRDIDNDKQQPQYGNRWNMTPPPPPPLKHQRMTVRMMVMRTFQRQPFLTLSRIWSRCTVDNTMKTILANTMKLTRDNTMRSTPDSTMKLVLVSTMKSIQGSMMKSIRASINIQNIKILRAPTQETTRSMRSK